MRVSIIIPALNEEKSIRLTLQAALAQDFPEDEYEIIVVDNGSTDDTAQIAGSFPKVLVCCEPRRGLSFARECGRKHAQGEILVNLDADCIPPPRWLKTGIKYFSNPAVVAAGGLYDYYDGTPWFRFIAAPMAQKLVAYTPIHLFLQYLLRKGGRLAGGNSFIRAETMRQIGGFDTSSPFIGEDR
jgi:glycosyltransferase involved in cell wall biosynthesis